MKNFKVKILSIVTTLSLLLSTASYGVSAEILDTYISEPFETLLITSENTDVTTDSAIEIAGTDKVNAIRENGYLKITYDTLISSPSGDGYTYDSEKNLVILQPGNYELVGDFQNTAFQVVEIPNQVFNWEEYNIILNSFYSVGTESNPPISVTYGNNVNLILVGKSEVYAQGNNAGIDMKNVLDSNNFNGSLKISGDGTLIAKGSGSGAGIGSSKNNNVGLLEIEINGTIEATGGDEGGAGIGSGAYSGNYTEENSINEVIILSGNIKSYGSGGGAGIGGGLNSPCKISLGINLYSTLQNEYNLNLEAYGSGGGAGIGSGNGYGRNTTNFDGGADYPETEIFIGSYTDSISTNLKILANGSGGGAGIGSGTYAGPSITIINAGEVIATGGNDGGAGIGGGAHSKELFFYGDYEYMPTEVAINGGDVNSTGYSGIGIGYNSQTAYKIDIYNDSKVLARAYDTGAGIGGGSGNINILGGDIVAIGGENGGAGLGVSADFDLNFNFDEVSGPDQDIEAFYLFNYYAHGINMNFEGGNLKTYSKDALAITPKSTVSPYIEVTIVNWNFDDNRVIDGYFKNPISENEARLIKATKANDTSQYIDLNLPAGYTSFGYLGDVDGEYVHSSIIDGEKKYFIVKDDLAVNYSAFPSGENIFEEGSLIIPTSNNIYAGALLSEIDLSINKIFKGDNVITGSALSNTKISVTINDGIPIVVNVNENGTWALILDDELQGGEVVTANLVLDGMTPEGISVKSAAVDTNNPSIGAKELSPPTIDTVFEDDTIIKGTGLPEATVEVVLNNGDILTGKVDIEGNWFVNVNSALLFPDENIIARQIFLVLVSPYSSTKINKHEAIVSPKPEIHKIFTTDKTIYGTGIVGSKIKVIFDEEKNIVLETVVQREQVKNRNIDETGTWSINLSQLPIDSNFKLIEGNYVLANQLLNVENAVISENEKMIIRRVDTLTPPYRPVTPVDPDPTEPEVVTPVDPNPTEPTNPDITDPTDPDTGSPETDLPETDLPETGNPGDGDDTTTTNPFVPSEQEPENEDLDIPDNAPFTRAEIGDDNLVYLFDENGVPLGTITFDDYINGNFDNIIPFGSGEVIEESTPVSKANPKTGDKATYPLAIGLLSILSVVIIMLMKYKKLNVKL